MKKGFKIIWPVLVVYLVLSMSPISAVILSADSTDEDVRLEQFMSRMKHNMDGKFKSIPTNEFKKVYKTGIRNGTTHLNVSVITFNLTNTTTYKPSEPGFLPDENLNQAYYANSSNENVDGFLPSKYQIKKSQKPEKGFLPDKTKINHKYKEHSGFLPEKSRIKTNKKSEQVDPPIDNSPIRSNLSPPYDNDYGNNHVSNTQPEDWDSMGPIYVPFSKKWDHTTKWIQKNKTLTFLAFIGTIILITVIAIATYYGIKYQQYARERELTMLVDRLWDEAKIPQPTTPVFGQDDSTSTTTTTTASGVQCSGGMPDPQLWKDGKQVPSVIDPTNYPAGCQFNDLDEAIKHAGNGYTIRLESGSYESYYHCDKSLTIALLPEQTGEAIINSILVEKGSRVIIDKGVTVKNVCLEHKTSYEGNGKLTTNIADLISSVPTTNIGLLSKEPTFHVKYSTSEDIYQNFFEGDVFFGSTTTTTTSALAHDTIFIGENVCNAPLYVKTDGNNMNDGLTLETAKRTIQAAITAAHMGGEVIVYPGSYDENIIIDKSLNLQGKDVFLNGMKKSSCITCTGALNKITIQGFTIMNGDNEKGGGIYNQSNLTLENCKIMSNNAVNGGGIYNQATLTLENCEITSNTAKIGGGIYNHDILNINKCKVGYNNAKNGGGLYNLKETLCCNAYFECNSAAYEGSGGAILTGENTDIKLYNVKFVCNSAGSGGAIDIQGAEVTAWLCNCDFISNRAETWGGAITNGGKCIIGGCNFKQNMGQICGAITNSSSGILTIVDTSKPMLEYDTFHWVKGLQSRDTQFYGNCCMLPDGAGAIFDFGKVFEIQNRQEEDNYPQFIKKG